MMKIFISYAEQEANLAEKLAVTLADHGHKVFFNEESWPVGETRRIRCRKAIKESGLFIFLVSPDSIKEGCEALSQLAIARNQWRSPKDRVLPVLAMPVDEQSIPVFIRSADLLKPDGELVSEISNAVYFAQKGQRTRKLVMGGLLGAMAMSLLTLSIYLGIKISGGEQEIVIDRQDILPSFEFSPPVILIYGGQGPGDLKLVNKSPVDAPSYRCRVLLPDDHRNIERVEYDEQCEKIKIIPKHKIFTDNNGKPYSGEGTQSHNEGILLEVTNSKGKVVWKSVLPVYLRNGATNFQLSGLERHENPTNPILSGYSIPLYKDVEIAIATGGKRLDDRFECKLILHRQGFGFKTKIIEKKSNCAFVLRAEYIQQGATDQYKKLGDYQRYQNAALVVRDSESDWEGGFSFKFIFTDEELSDG